LVPGDTNGKTDVFVRDRQAGVTRRVSVGAAGQANGASGGSYGNGGPTISAGGRYVAFTSDASNLVPGDTNETTDVFVRDRQAGVTRRVSVGAAGQANGPSAAPAISADGRYVAFASDASNLVPGDTNGTTDVFVRDLRLGVTRRVSVGAAGQGNGSSGGSASGPTISANGRYVAFNSGASNLVHNDTITGGGLFVRDRLAGVTRRVSIGDDGQAPNYGGAAYPVITADGRSVAFTSGATNLVPVSTEGATEIYVRGPEPRALDNS
jgi:Tol biopolymer transport system component